MAKRTASRDINHENWDQEEEPEEAGTFQRASEEQLKSRVFKIARRRNVTSHNSVSRLPTTTVCYIILYIFHTACTNTVNKLKLEPLL